MPNGTAPAPRERGWWRIILALAALLLVPHIPGGPSTLPVVDTLVLLVPALAACCVVGWWAGGSPWLALIWSALAAAIIVLPPPAGVDDSYYALARGWGVIVAAAFGVVCVVGRSQPFISRALLGIGLATVLSLGVIVTGRLEPDRAQRVFASQFAERNSAAVEELQQDATAVAQSFPNLSAMARDVASRQGDVQTTLSAYAAPLYPASLALEALAALALAWALFHRLSRVRIGAPLSPLKQFTFGDQLVWALVAGIAMILMPARDALTAIGTSVLIFFGTLYALRGYGIYAWFISRRVAVTSVAVAVAAFPLSLVTVPWAVGLGVSDTWIDWRRRIKHSLSSGRDR
ncbi:MAG TPA: hypothetical protein VJO52_08135 [Gemmatimonadaceae bacterium]|nr:hypothetical protein [Gemmatimonadaceae bacterium]